MKKYFTIIFMVGVLSSLVSCGAGLTGTWENRRADDVEIVKFSGNKFSSEYYYSLKDTDNCSDRHRYVSFGRSGPYIITNVFQESLLITINVDESPCGCVTTEYLRKCSGTYSIIDGKIEFLYDNGNIVVYSFSRTENTFTLSTNTGSNQYIKKANINSNNSTPKDRYVEATQSPTLTTPQKQDSTSVLQSSESDMQNTNDNPASFAEVNMPNLIGHNWVEARNILMMLDVELEIITEAVENDDLPEGEVFETTPKYGEPLYQGYMVTIKYAKPEGEIVVYVPDLVGFSETDAREQLSGLDLNIEWDEDWNDDVATGYIAYMSVRGVNVPADSTIYIFVSKGSR